MAEKLKQLIYKRGQIKSRLTRFKTYFESLNDASHITQLKVRLVKLESCATEFDDVQSEIEFLDQSKTETHEREREEFDAQYYNLVEAAHNYISDMSNVSSNGNVGTDTEPKATAKIKLPQISLPTFNGAYEQWLPFFDTFNSLIHTNKSLENIEKFHYLRSSLKGDAANVVEALEVSASNYPIAWSLLKDRFENKKLIVHSHVKALFELPHATKESHMSLRQLLDGVLKHLRALKTLGQPTDSWDTLIIYLISMKLDHVTKKEWELSVADNELPSMQGITKFLQTRCQVLETLEGSKTYKDNNSHGTRQTKFRPRNQESSSLRSRNYEPSPFRSRSHEPASFSLVTSQRPCPLCTQSHYIFACEEFSKQPISSRVQEVQKHNLCLNCLKPGHFSKDCRRGKCRVCSRRHNTQIHQDIASSSSSSNQQLLPNEQQPSTSTLHSSYTSSQESQIVLATAVVVVFSASGEPHQCRVLLDSGSQSNFITSALCDKLNLTVNKINIPVTGINQSITNITCRTQATIKSRFNGYSTRLSFLILQRITGNIPTFTVDVSQLQVPVNITLADPDFNKSSTIDMLLGAEIFYELLCIGQIKPSKYSPMFQKTHLGWVISGKMMVPTQNATKIQAATACNLSTLSDLDYQLSKFWELEEYKPNCLYNSPEEKDCEMHFQQNTRRDSDGRFSVRLPLKGKVEQLGKSRDSALKRLYTLEKKLNNQPALKLQYHQFMTEYENLGHMALVSEEEQPQEVINYYLPHHGVLKETSITTKLRVVFDGSAKTTSGASLNDILLVGPNLQRDIFDIITRFRIHKYVITADIEKMYRQVKVESSDRRLQRILWRRSTDERVLTYELTTITYGTASAPYLAMRCLRQLALDGPDKFPLAASALERDFYMDDLISGANSIPEIIQLRNELIILLQGAGLKLRKWASNDSSCLAEIPLESTEPSTLLLDGANENKTLGLLWKPNSDVLLYAINLDHKPRKITERTVLSNIASIYDPLGLLAPVIVTAKLMMHSLWQLQLGWDESLPVDLHTTWMQYQEQLPLLNKISVKRGVVCTNPINLQLHGFCDASELAYGACIYIRSTDDQGRSFVHLLCSKSRVAPLKRITLPKLELCGALLLAQLYQKTIKALNLNWNDCCLWTDSTIVLAWLSASPSQWKTFTANRVAQIQELAPEVNWRHVRSQDNPADIVSRGATPNQLLEFNLWWQGPSWLPRESNTWPISNYLDSVPNDIPEQRKTLTTLVTNIVPFDVFTKYSSLTKLQRVMAYCLRFKCNSSQATKLRRTGNLSTEELQQSLTCLLKITQIQEFKQEIQSLQTNRTIDSKSKLLTLNPFLDKKGLLRVGGRIKNASVPYDQRHPIILPAAHSLTKLIIQHEHIQQLHAGTQAVLAGIRTRYWPLAARSAIRKIIHNCVKCFKANPRGTETIMGDLPPHRVQIARPFSTSGVDYAGPFTIKASKGRKRQIIKAYLCLFICFSTKAVHLELVADLTTDAFVAALKRFVARRGKPLHIYSDNGTNFVGANNELAALKEFLTSEEHNKEIENFSTNQNISWHFIPPRSPHFGGLWEAGVKSAKCHLKRIMGNDILTYEELNTVIIQIEACLNSRPITPLSNDPDDLSALTPGHFLIGDSLIAYQNQI